MAQDGSDGLGGPTEAANAIPPGERSTLELAHVVDPEVPARFEEEIRTTARALLAVHGVSQTKLAEALGVSQSSVSHMLTNRSYGLTTTEVWWVETLAEVRHGTIYEAVSLEGELADVKSRVTWLELEAQDLRVQIARLQAELVAHEAKFKELGGREGA